MKKRYCRACEDHVDRPLAFHVNCAPRCVLISDLAFFGFWPVFHNHAHDFHHSARLHGYKWKCLGFFFQKLSYSVVFDVRCPVAQVYGVIESASPPVTSREL